MGFLKRLWGYIKALFRSKAEDMMDPEIEIKQAINEARKRDQDLRNQAQAAKVVAHRTQLESKIERSAEDAGEARELAKQALIRAQDSTTAGDTGGYRRRRQVDPFGTGPGNEAAGFGEQPGRDEEPVRDCCRPG